MQESTFMLRLMLQGIEHVSCCIIRRAERSVAFTSRLVVKREAFLSSGHDTDVSLFVCVGCCVC